MDRTTDFQERLPRHAVYPWPGAGVVFRAALHPRILLAGVIAACLLQLGDRTLDTLASGRWQAAASTEQLLPSIPASLTAVPTAVSHRTLQWLQKRSSWAETLVLLPGLIWSLLVCGLFGGAIVRCVAVVHATDKPLPLLEGLRFAARRLGGLTLAPLVAVILFAGMWTLRTALLHAEHIPVAGPYLIVAASGIGWCLFGVAAALLCLSAAAWPLMLAAGCVEDLDGLDGFSRAVNFVLSRPLLYAGHLLAGAILVSGVALPVHLTTFLFGPKVSMVLQAVSAGLAASAFFAWSAVTFVRLRQQIDSIETDDIVFPAAAGESVPEIPLAGRTAHPV